jgi:2-C-methyl-D-erythritol 4-phosphate cytidylyltransferase/2-C-methyl-D-erythritol 2,4-cyclodiphosphate synthase
MILSHGMQDQQTRIAVILAAAGAGTRCGPGEPKQWRPLSGGSLLERSWRSFLPASLAAAGQSHRVAWLGLVVDEPFRNRAEVSCGRADFPTEVIPGGVTRMASVGNALARLPAEIGLVAVHDAVRPFWPLDRWDRLIAAAATADGAILAVPATDTLKKSAGESLVTMDRRSVWIAQTPQVFRADVLREAHRRASAEGISATDDAELVERTGGRTIIVESTTANIKITTQEDWAMAQRLVASADHPTVLRVGVGFDAHRLGGDRPLVLGGVRLAESGGLIGHSDGDALLHAICDALLGAAALGDIGRHFPPGDKRFAGIDSRVLLRQTVQLLQQARYRPRQVDTVVLAEAPRIAPFADRMCENIATDLGIDPDAVSVKATTTEQMGFVGRGEGIAVHAIVTIEAVVDATTGGPQ